MSAHAYIHIPFCLSKCPYCAFVSVRHEGGLAEEYVQALLAEIAMTEAGGPLETLYMGGGTPTVLSDEALERIFISVSKHYGLKTGAEVTVEANPGTVDKHKAGVLLGLGVNRISIGVQSFDEQELRALGRLHTAKEAEQAVLTVKAAGFENVSLDLMFGIPGQTLNTWRETLRHAVGLGPRHVSAYELTPEPETLLFVSIERGEINMPDEGLVLDMFGLAAEVLGGAGLKRYEVSNYAVEGFSECRHNVNCWRRGTYAGLGAAAHGFDGKHRVRNTGSIEKYIDELKHGRLPALESTELGLEDIFCEQVMLALRTVRGLDVREVEGGRRAALLETAKELQAEGFLLVDGDFIRLTEDKGFPLANSVVLKLVGREIDALRDQPLDLH